MLSVKLLNGTLRWHQKKNKNSNPKRLENSRAKKESDGKQEFILVINHFKLPRNGITATIKHTHSEGPSDLSTQSCMKPGE